MKNFKTAIIVLTATALLVASALFVGCGGNTGGGGALKVTVNDVYFEDHYMRAMLGPGIDKTPYESLLYVRVTVKCTRGEVGIAGVFIQDTTGKVWDESSNFVWDDQTLTPVEQLSLKSGETRTGLTAVLLGIEIPKDGRGLKLLVKTIETDPITLSVGNTDSIRHVAVDNAGNPITT